MLDSFTRRDKEFAELSFKLNDKIGLVIAYDSYAGIYDNERWTQMRNLIKHYGLDDLGKRCDFIRKNTFQAYHVLKN
jgi:hypothetical protein